MTEQAEVRMGISAMEIPFLVGEATVLHPPMLGIAGTLAVLPLPQALLLRPNLEGFIQEILLGGVSSAEERMKGVQALQDVSGDGLGISKTGVSETPVILQVDLEAVDPGREAAREAAREGLRRRLRALAPGSVVIAYADSRAKKTADPFGPLMQEFPLLRYERKVHLGEIDLREARAGRDRWARALGIDPGHSGFLFSSHGLLKFKEEMKNLGLVFQFDPRNLPEALKPFQGHIEAAVMGEWAEHVKLTEAVRRRILAENRARGLFRFLGGAYSLNLNLWLEIRTSELVSASA